MSNRSVYEGSVNSAVANLAFGGAAGQGTGTLIPNNTQQFPSIQAIESAYAIGIITQTQRVGLKHAAAMNAQTVIQAARDLLASQGDTGPR